MGTLQIPGIGQASNEFGRKLKQVRERAGFSRKELAELLGMRGEADPANSVRRWEAGFSGVKNPEKLEITVQSAQLVKHILDLTKQQLRDVQRLAKLTGLNLDGDE